MFLRCKGKTLFDTDIFRKYCIFAQNLNTMKRFGIIAVLLVMLLGSSNQVSAQFFQDEPNMKGKITYGGGFAFGLNFNTLNLSLAPQVGYRILSPWEVGLRGIYNLRCNFAYREYFHYVGFSPYTNCQIFRGLFIHAEYENLYGFARLDQESVGGSWYRSVFVGGGFRSSSYGGGYFVMLLYNLSWNYNKFQNDWLYPYGSPFVIRVGFCF